MSAVDVEKLVEHKREGYYPSFVHFAMKVPAKEDRDIVIEVPTEYVYIMTHDEYNVEEDVFEYRCLRDGRMVSPKTLITADLMQYVYTEPFIAINEIHGIVRNIDEEETHKFRVTYYILVCKAERFEKGVM